MTQYPPASGERPTGNASGSVRQAGPRSGSPRHLHSDGARGILSPSRADLCGLELEPRGSTGWTEYGLSLSHSWHGLKSRS
jgi:hypothetical protein